MQKRQQAYLKEQRNGFSGVNHVLIAIGLILLILLLPSFFDNPFSNFMKTNLSPHDLKSGVFTFFAVVLIMGGALLPDVDNSKADGGSMATWELGFIGSCLSSVMIMTSSFMTSIFKTKKDRLPPTQHRMFWHTLLVPLLMYLMIHYMCRGSSTTLYEVIKGSVDTRGINSLTLVFDFIALSLFVCLGLYVGAMCALKKVCKFVPVLPQKFVKLFPGGFTIVGLILCVAYFSIDEIKVLAYFVVIGYLFHLIGDLFADTGIPALFPIDVIIRRKFWGRYCLLGPFSPKTGSTLESVLKFVFLAVDITLLVMLTTGVFVFDLI